MGAKLLCWFWNSCSTSTSKEYLVMLHSRCL